MTDETPDTSDEDKSKFEQSVESIKAGAIKSGKAVADASIKSGKAVAEASKKAADSASKFASEIGVKIAQKKTEIAENRKKKKADFIESLKADEKYKEIITDSERLPPMVSVPVFEHQEMIETIQRLENEVDELKISLKEALDKEPQVSNETEHIEQIENEDVKEEKPEQKNKEMGLSGEVGSSLNQILITMGVSVLWAIILIIVNFQLEQKGFEFSGLDTKAVVWPIGTAIWTLFLLSSQSKAGTLLSMDLSNRIKTSIGIGLATTLSLMLTDGEMQAITNVWGWTMTIALCAFLLSGFVRGIISSLRKISKMVGI